MYIGINDHWYQIIISGMVTFERKLLSCERYERITVSFDSSFGETLCKIEIKESKTETTLSNSERSFFKPEMNLQTALRKQRREEVMPPMTPESSVWVKRILKHERILLIRCRAYWRERGGLSPQLNLLGLEHHPVMPSLICDRTLPSCFPHPRHLSPILIHRSVADTWR